MLCSKCNGILDVIKIHDIDSLKPRLCDVQCLECGKIVYLQPYDWGTRLNLVTNSENQN